MTTRTNTAKWTGTRWRIDVQKDGTRKSFYSSTPGRTGQREANAKADKWLQTGVTDTAMRVRQAYASTARDNQRGPLPQHCHALAVLDRTEHRQQEVVCPDRTGLAEHCQ